MDYQQDVHADSSRYALVAGGYGSGKSATCYKDDEKHILLTKGRTLMGADTLPQLENTVKKDFETDMPIDFVRKYSVQKNVITFKNGHELMYRPLNDEGNLRSLNLTRFHIVEASETKFDNFTQLTTRLRNTDGVRFKRDKEGKIIFNGGYPEIQTDLRKGILETNPDAGWVRNEFLLKSGCIQQYNKRPYYTIEPEQCDPNKKTFIIPTDANYHLPPGFKTEISRGKPQWWINKFIYGSFDYSEGLVYSSINRCIVERNPIDNPNRPTVRYGIGMDYGINDNTHFVFLMIDTEKKMIVAYDEIQTNHKTIQELAGLYKEKRDKIPREFLNTPVMDGRSINKTADTLSGNFRTIGQMFSDCGCYFKPAQMNLDARIMRLNTFIENGQFYIVRKACPGLVAEITDYKFQERTLDGSSKGDPNKPVDKNNHGVNALEFAIMEIPLDFNYNFNYERKSEEDLEAERRRLYAMSMSPFNSTPIRRTRTNLRDLGGTEGW
jgi:hypothetical protein